MSDFFVTKFATNVYISLFFLKKTTLKIWFRFCRNILQLMLLLNIKGKERYFYSWIIAPIYHLQFLMVRTFPSIKLRKWQYYNQHINLNRHKNRLVVSYLMSFKIVGRHTMLGRIEILSRYYLSTSLGKLKSNKTMGFAKLSW